MNKTELKARIHSTSDGALRAHTKPKNQHPHKFKCEQTFLINFCCLNQLTANLNLNLNQKFAYNVQVLNILARCLFCLGRICSYSNVLCLPSLCVVASLYLFFLYVLNTKMQESECK